MTKLQVFAQAMLPIAGRTGTVFVEDAARTLVTSLGARMSVVLDATADGLFRPLVAFAGDARVEDRLGAAVDLSTLEARCRAILAREPSLVFRAAASEHAAACVLADGPVDEPLENALSFVAARIPAELERTKLERRAGIERRMGLVADASDELVWHWSLATDTIQWIDAALAEGTMTLDEFRARVHPGDRARVEAELEELRAGSRDRWDDAVRFLRGGPRTRVGQVRAVLERSPDGKPMRVLGSLHDVTEAKAHEQRLVLAERMASMGTLAAGVAHEINNPLAYVKGNVEHVLDELRKDPKIDKDLIAALDEAREGADRIRAMVQDLGLFSRAHDDVLCPVDVDRAVESALTFVASEIEKRARLEKVLSHPPPVEASDARLGHVILALLVNAVHALPEGAPESHVVRVETGVAEDGRVFLVVSDSGVGIPGDILGRIFDPFFTTKPVGEGTGLGLSIAHSIVTSLGGEISIDSAPGAGSTFRILLPRARTSSP